VAALSDQDRWPGTDIRVSVATQGPRCREGRCESPFASTGVEPLSRRVQRRRNLPRAPLAHVAHQPERRLTRADLARHQPCATHALCRCGRG
jgi:hypothetical protein